MCGDAGACESIACWCTPWRIRRWRGNSEPHRVRCRAWTILIGWNRRCWHRNRSNTVARTGLLATMHRRQPTENLLLQIRTWALSSDGTVSVITQDTEQMMQLISSFCVIFFWFQVHVAIVTKAIRMIVPKWDVYQPMVSNGLWWRSIVVFRDHPLT